MTKSKKGQRTVVVKDVSQDIKYKYKVTTFIEAPSAGEAAMRVAGRVVEVQELDDKAINQNIEDKFIKAIGFHG